MNWFLSTASITVLSATVSLSALAAVPDHVAERLKGDLTPLGAERGGDGQGIIPPWSAQELLPDVEVYPDNPNLAPAPFANDPVLTTITSENADRFANRLTATHRALLAAYPDSYRMPIYRSRRTCQIPAAVHEATFENATQAELAEGGNGVVGATSGTPFPIPNNAYEIIWNHLLAYRGHKVSAQKAMWAPGDAGKYVLSKYLEDVIHFWSPENETIGFRKGMSRYLLRVHIAPEKAVGTVFLEHTSQDHALNPTFQWTYSPNTRRVRRAPQAAFDGPVPFAGNFLTYDSQKGFDGSPTLYDWTIVEKASYYLPNNSHSLSLSRLQYENVLSTSHLNQDHTRYELQRVWVVEAHLKEDSEHSYHRRRFYVLEDNWQILATEQYDINDNLVSGQEMFPQFHSEAQLCDLAAEATYHFAGRSYVARELRNQETSPNFDATELDLYMFTPISISPHRER